MTVSDHFYGGSEHLPEGLQPYYEQFKQSLESQDRAGEQLRYTPLWKAYEKIGIDDSGEVFVGVDLHAPEEKIVSDFRHWLTDIRIQKGVKAPSKRLTASDFRNWSDYGLLPYLDLSNWASARDIQITQQVIGAAIFPGEYDLSLSERIRKVVAPMARGVTHEAFTDALRAQALAELAEQNSTKAIPDKWDNVVITDGGWMPLEPD